MKLSTLLVFGALFSCATTKEPEEAAKPKVVTPAFYTLKEGAKSLNTAPLPDSTQILVKWTDSDGGTNSKDGFRGWDIDHDGRFDMLEVMDQAGQPSAWAYDFDGDGVVDLVQKADEKMGQDEAEVAPVLPVYGAGDVVSKKSGQIRVAPAPKVESLKSEAPQPVKASQKAETSH